MSTNSPLATTSRGRSGPARMVGVIAIISGLVFAVAGAAAYYVVHDTLADQKITVADDADMLAGDEVDGPFSAYAQASVIDKHATEMSDGKTYAELDQDDPVRESVMDASFLQASLFTSVVAFGVAAMAFVMGILWILLGWALMGLGRRTT